MRWSLQLLAAALALCGAVFCSVLPEAAKDRIGGDASAAICPIVYPLDESSEERGYRYIFYGNGFFINREGYLLTAGHVLSDFQNGGEPHILLHLPEAPPRLVKVEIVASDPEHDVAILRAVPNPFEGRYEISALPLSSSKPSPGVPILTLAFRPAELKDPRSFDAPKEERSLADVLQYTAIPLSKGQPKVELFLFNHEVLRGHSGAPILRRDTQEVVGIVEGQWLHGIPLPSATSPGSRGNTLGAGVPITYAVDLLDQQHVAWQTLTGPSK